VKGIIPWLNCEEHFVHKAEDSNAILNWGKNGERNKGKMTTQKSFDVAA
jgi:hypothetical protein